MPDELLESWDDAFAIIARANGDVRHTATMRAALKEFGPPIHFNPPTEEEVERARSSLPVGILALGIVIRKVEAHYPQQHLEETERQFRERLKTRGRTDSVLWKKAILLEAEFRTPTWITAALAQDMGWRRSPPNLLDQAPHQVLNEQRVHIVGSVGDPPKTYVLYPRAIKRVTGEYEVGSGKISPATITLSEWKVIDGWIMRAGSPSRAGKKRTEDSGDGGPEFKPSSG